MPAATRSPPATSPPSSQPRGWSPPATAGPSSSPSRSAGPIRWRPRASWSSTRTAGGRRSRSGTDFVPAPSLVLERAEVRAGVVYVGFGVTAPEFGYDDYAGIDVAGKVVAMLWGAPARFPSDARAFYSSRRGKAELAARHGAVGVVSFRTPEEARRVPFERLVERVNEPSMAWLDENGAPDGSPAGLVAHAVLSDSGARALFAGASRHDRVGLRGRLRAGARPACRCPSRSTSRPRAGTRRSEAPTSSASFAARTPSSPRNTSSSPPTWTTSASGPRGTATPSTTARTTTPRGARPSSRSPRPSPGCRDARVARCSSPR